MTDYSIKRFSKYTKEELVAALREFANKKRAQYVASRDFCDWFGVSEMTIVHHFGTWSKFCKRADLEPRYNRTKERDELLQNLGRVWEALGRQPRAKEMKQPVSAISNSRYLREFGSWYKACLEFLSWKSGMSVRDIQSESKMLGSVEPIEGKAKRGISLALRYEVLKRDHFRCVLCGRSPAVNPGVILHVDHNVPWSKGGETVIENLQILCSECNLGKGQK
jgi:5-methylcytosine-specific restriction endonuclease McrA